MMNGFNYSEHIVKTEDGYINTVFRINKGEQVENTRRPAVLMVHGLIDSASCWITNTRDKAQAFILADEGYDVWLANTRGNKYSRQHEVLDSDVDIEYWDFGYALQIGKYDIPAFLEYAKKVSRVNNLTVVAHSQGSQMMLYNLERNATYYSKNVNLLVTLGTVARATTTTWINKFAAAWFHYLDPLVHPLKLWETFSKDSFFTKYAQMVCMYSQKLCNLGI